MSSVGEVEIPKDFNDHLIMEDDGTLDKFKLDSMGSFEVYENEQNTGVYQEEETIYKNQYSNKIYTRFCEVF